MATNKLADILKQEYKTKGLFSGATSAIGKSAREKLDIRNALFGGSGLGSVIGRKIFGKGYSALGADKSGGKMSSDNLVSESSSVLKEVSINTEITAKNTLALPSMARDMHLVKQNIAKLVKLQGGTPTTKAGDWFSRQAARESAFEARFNKKDSPTKVTEKKENSGILGLIGGAMSMLGGLISGLASGVSSLSSMVGTIVGGLGLFGKSIFKVLMLLAKTRLGKMIGLGAALIGGSSLFGGDANASELDPNLSNDTNGDSKSGGLSLGTTAAAAVGAVGTAKFATKVPSLAKATGTAILDAKTTTTGSVVGSTSNTKWSRFLKFVAKRSPKLWARIGVKLAQCGALMAIPFAGWIGALINFGFTLWLAWDIYTLWKEFTGNDTEENSDVAETTAKNATQVSNQKTESPGSTPQNTSPTKTSGATYTGNLPAMPEKNNMADLIRKKFKEAGFSDAQAEAAVANAWAESRFNPNAHNTTGEDSVGLFQMNRKGGLGKGYSVEQLKDPNFNIDLAIKAAKNSKAFRDSKTVEESVAAFVNDVERPADKAGAIASRTAVALGKSPAGPVLAQTEGGAATGAKLNTGSRSAANQAPAPSSQAPVVVDNKTINNTQVASSGGGSGMTAYDQYFGKYLINRTT